MLHVEPDHDTVADADSVFKESDRQLVLKEVQAEEQLQNDTDSPPRLHGERADGSHDMNSEGRTVQHHGGNPDRNGEEDDMTHPKTEPNQPYPRRKKCPGCLETVSNCICSTSPISGKRIRIPTQDVLSMEQQRGRSSSDEKMSGVEVNESHRKEDPDEPHEAKGEGEEAAPINNTDPQVEVDPAVELERLNQLAAAQEVEVHSSLDESQCLLVAQLIQNRDYLEAQRVLQSQLENLHRLTKLNRKLGRPMKGAKRAPRQAAKQRAARASDGMEEGTVKVGPEPALTNVPEGASIPPEAVKTEAAATATIDADQPQGPEPTAEVAEADAAVPELEKESGPLPGDVLKEPKPARTAFMIFESANTELYKIQIMSRSDDSDSTQKVEKSELREQVKKAILNAWNALPDSSEHGPGKEHYLRLAQKEKERYENELSKFFEKGGMLEPTKPATAFALYIGEASTKAAIDAEVERMTLAESNPTAPEGSDSTAVAKPEEPLPTDAPSESSPTDLPQPPAAVEAVPTPALVFTLPAQASSDSNRVAGKLWLCLPWVERLPYLLAADALKVQYDRDMEEWRKRGFGLGPKSAPNKRPPSEYNLFTGDYFPPVAAFLGTTDVSVVTKKLSEIFSQRVKSQPQSEEALYYKQLVQKEKTRSEKELKLWADLSRRKAGGSTLLAVQAPTEEAPVEVEALPVASPPTDESKETKESEKKDKSQKKQAGTSGSNQGSGPKPALKGMQTLDLFFKRKVPEAEVIVAPDPTARRLESEGDFRRSSSHPNDGDRRQVTGNAANAPANNSPAKVLGAVGATSESTVYIGSLTQPPNYYLFYPLGQGAEDSELNSVPIAQRIWNPSGPTAPQSGNTFSVFEGIREAPAGFIPVNPFAKADPAPEIELSALLGLDDPAITSKLTHPLIRPEQFHCDCRSLGLGSTFNSEVVLSAMCSQTWEKLDIRPPYYGTWNSKIPIDVLINQFARFDLGTDLSPNKQGSADVLAPARLSTEQMASFGLTLDYDVDSGDEWDDEPADGDDLNESDGSSDSSEDEDDDSDCASFIDDNPIEGEDSEEEGEAKELHLEILHRQKQKQRETVLEPKLVRPTLADPESVLFVQDPTGRRPEFSSAMILKLFMESEALTAREKAAPGEGHKSRKEKKNTGKDSDTAAVAQGTLPPNSAIPVASTESASTLEAPQGILTTSIAVTEKLLFPAEPRTAYYFFEKERKEQLKQSGSSTAASISTKALKQEFEGLLEAERASYKAKEQEDILRFKLEYNQYVERGGMKRKPVAPRTSLQFYMEERRQEFPEAKEDELIKTLSAQLSQLPPEVQQQYADMALKDKERYESEKLKFNSQTYQREEVSYRCPYCSKGHVTMKLAERHLKTCKSKPGAAAEKLLGDDGNAMPARKRPPSPILPSKEEQALEPNSSGFLPDGSHADAALAKSSPVGRGGSGAPSHPGTVPALDASVDPNTGGRKRSREAQDPIAST